MRSVGCVTFHLGRKNTKTCAIILGLLASITVVGAILAAVVSNMLTFGPFQLQGYVGDAVSLSEVDVLPASISIKMEERIKFDIIANIPVPNATLWFKLSADVSLNDPNIVKVEYEHPGSSSRALVPLTATGGTLSTLNGPLKSGWNIPEGFFGEGRLYITFLTSAPTTTTYSIDIWVDAELGSGAAPGTSETYISLGDNFFSPDLVNISVGDTVTWNWAGSPHTTTGTASWNGAEVIFGIGSESWNSNILSVGSFSHTFNSLGTFTYVCTLHSGMEGTIVVQ